MLRLYCRYYEACDGERFQRDLAEKDYVILLHDLQGDLRGFSTLEVLAFEYDGRPQRAVFSGDTIVHHQFWGGQTLPLAWCRLAGRIKAQAPGLPLYWFLISKGHRTYRYLPLFAKRFYPTWRYETPSAIQALMDGLARQKFGDTYDPSTGLIRFPRSHGHLRTPWAEVDSRLSEKPDVRYFLNRNPGHRRGDELVCLTELCSDNLRSHALRAFSAAA